MAWRLIDVCLFGQPDKPVRPSGESLPMDWIHTVFKSVPETALFLSLAIGYAVGNSL